MDLRKLSAYLKVVLFHMLRTVDMLEVIRQGNCFTTVNLRDAHFNVPSATQHRQFLRFTFERRAYQYHVLLFGISLALAPLQARGMHIFPYLNDWLICSQSKEEAIRESSVLLSHIR